MSLANFRIWLEFNMNHKLINCKVIFEDLIASNKQVITNNK